MAARVNVPLDQPRRALATALAALMLLLGSAAALAAGAPSADGLLRVRVAFEPDLGVNARATIEIDGRAHDLGDAWVELRLPPGSYPLHLHTPGLTFTGAPELEVSDGGDTELTLGVRPVLRLLAPERVSVERDGRTEFSAVIVTDYPHTLPVSLAAAAAAGVQHHGASALRGVARSDLRPELRFHATVATDAEALVLRLEPGGVEHRVAWLHPAGATGAPGAAATDAEPPANAATEPPATSLQLDLHGPDQTLLPGDPVQVHATIRNDGDAPVTYTLRWQTPEWLSGDAAERVGALAPGASERHRLDAVVAFGPPAHAVIEAFLEVGDERLQAAHPLSRELLELAWADVRSRAPLGNDQHSVVRVTNPTDRDLALTKLLALGGALAHVKGTELPDTLAGDADTDVWLAPPGESEHVIRWHARSEGAGVIELALAGDQSLVAHRLVRELLVETPAAPARRTTVRLPVTLSHPVRELLVWLALPPEVQVEAGSSRLDDEPLPDPVAVAGGALWRVATGDAHSPRLTFVLAHEQPLPALPEPVLAARAGAALLPLAGRLPAGVVEALPSTAGLPSTAAPLTVPARGERDGTAARAADARPASAVQPRGATAPAAEASPAQPPLRLLEPTDGTTYRPDEAVRVVIDAAAAVTLELRVNETAVPASRLGLHQHDPASGRQRLEYYGLDFRPGVNSVSVHTEHGNHSIEIYLARAPERLEVVPVQVRADGVSEIVLEVRALDERGVPNGFGPLRVTPTRPLLDADAFPELAGHHALVRDGRTLLRFAPSATGGAIDLELRFAELDARSRVALEAEPRLLWTAQGSLAASFTPDGTRLDGSGRGYLEAAGAFGSVQFAFDAGVRLEPDLSVRYRPGMQPLDSERFPLTGAAEPATDATLRSDDGVALRYEREGLALRYEAGRVAVPGVTPSAYGSALHVHAELHEGHTATLVAGLLPLQQLRQRIEPDGTRRYALDAVPRVGSERVTLLVLRDGLELERHLLRPGEGYVIDRHAPAIMLARALWKTDLDGNELALEVTYAPEDAPREALALGAGWTYRDGPWTLEAGAASLPHEGGSGTTLGVVARYHEVGLEVAAGYERRLWEDSGRARLDARWHTPNTTLWGALALGVEQRAALHGRVRLPEIGVELGGDLRVAREQPAAIDAHARVAITDDLRLRLQHALEADAHTSSALLEHQAGAMTLAGGLRYAWDDGALLALAGATWEGAGTRVRLEHAQGLSLTTTSTSELELDVPLASALLRARLQHVWGEGSSGVLGLQQHLAGGANAGLELRLPDAGGAPVAHASLSAPVALSEELRLDLQAGIERPLSADGAFSAAFSVGARYASETLSAGAAADLALRAQGPKLVLQADVRWEPGPAHVLAVDANAQLLTDPSARLNLSYAYHDTDVSLLTYHRARFDPTLVLEGEVGLALRPDPAWSLRPSLAYRALGGDADAFVLQSGYGATYHDPVGVQLGAVFYHTWQPVLGVGVLALGAEVGYEFVPGASLVLGYTLGEGPGLLAGGAPGAHVRLDVHGGTQ